MSANGNGNRKVGAWLVGALGSVSTLVAAGLEAMRLGRAAPVGLVTAGPEFEGVPLVAPEEIVLGGCDVRGGDLVRSAEEYARVNGVLTAEMLEAVRPGLQEITADLRPGIALNCGEAVRRLAPLGSDRDRMPLREAVAAIQADLRAFQARRGLDEVVVVNLASAEPEWEAPPETETAARLAEAIERDRRERLPASVLYAWAALDAGFPYVNFTSSAGSSLPALEELARRKGVPHAGRDAKTGETLVKTALAPMFAARRLRVLAWEGHNLLGNRDGQVLDVPEHNRAKVANKDAALRDLLGQDLHSRVRIDYVPSLGDWKTAWDFIQFEGFLGARMSMQFTWQGCDSALAAPLAIDLVRLADLAHRSGEAGAMRHTAAFFKAPWGTDDHDFHRQADALVAYALSQRASKVPRPAGP